MKRKNESKYNSRNSTKKKYQKGAVKIMDGIKAFLKMRVKGKISYRKI